MAAIGIEKVRQILASRPDRHSISLSERRATMDAMGAGGELPSNLEILTTKIGGVNSECIAFTHSPLERSILYVHGGAYVAGSPLSHRRLGISLSEKVNARVMMLDYRLAPESPFPAAVIDVVAAYRHMQAKPNKFGAIALVGDSAGADPKNPLASPVYADLNGLPPMLIQAGSEEVLIDEITTFASAAKHAGTDITLQIWPKMIHVFHAFSTLLPDARTATDQLASFICSKLT